MKVTRPKEVDGWVVEVEGPTVLKKNLKFVLLLWMQKILLLCSFCEET